MLVVNETPSRKAYTIRDLYRVVDDVQRVAIYVVTTIEDHVSQGLLLHTPTR